MDVPLWSRYAVIGAVPVMLFVDLVAYRQSHATGVGGGRLIGRLNAVRGLLRWPDLAASRRRVRPAALRGLPDRDVAGGRQRCRHEHLNPERSRALRLFRRWAPMTDAYCGQRFVMGKNGVTFATLLADHTNALSRRGRRDGPDPGRRGGCCTAHSRPPTTQLRSAGSRRERRRR